MDGKGEWEREKGDDIIMGHNGRKNSEEFMEVDEVGTWKG